MEFQRECSIIISKAFNYLPTLMVIAIHWESPQKSKPCCLVINNSWSNKSSLFAFSNEFIIVQPKSNYLLEAFVIMYALNRHSMYQYIAQMFKACNLNV